MTQDQIKQIRKDAYNHMYRSFSKMTDFTSLYLYLNTIHQNLKNESQIEGVYYNTIVNDIFKELTGYSCESDFRMKIGASVKPSMDTQVLLNQLVYLKNVIFVGDTPNKTFDLYTISLRFFKEHQDTGVTRIEYFHHIKNVHNIDLSTMTLGRLYAEITNTDQFIGIEKDLKGWATLESIFRLLEFEELQHSLKESKDARKEAQKSMTVAVFSIIITFVTFGVSLWFMIVQTDVAQQTYSLEVSNTAKEDSSHVLDSILYYQKQMIKVQNKKLNSSKSK